MASSERFPQSELVELLSPSLGEAASRELVVRIATKLKLDSNQFTVATALKVLEHMAQEPGLVGITARFSKTRLILKWGHTK